MYRSEGNNLGLLFDDVKVGPLSQGVDTLLDLTFGYDKKSLYAIIKLKIGYVTNYIHQVVLILFYVFYIYLIVLLPCLYLYSILPYKIL